MNHEPGVDLQGGGEIVVSQPQIIVTHIHTRTIKALQCT